MFSAEVSEKLGWYVYALRNPIDSKVFYVGKGKGNRVFDHAHNAIDWSADEAASPKIEVIQKILAQGLEVETFMIRHSLADEGQAYEIEASVIDAIRLVNLGEFGKSNLSDSLTNAVLGHYAESKGLATTAAVAESLSVEPAPEFEHPGILIKIAQMWSPTMTAEGLYEATRKWWVIGEKRLDAKYAFAVCHGVIREVYAINSWESGSYSIDAQAWVAPPATGESKLRWRFDGVRAGSEFDKYRRKSVADLVAKTQNPIRYVGF